MDFRNYSRLPDAPDYWESLATRVERSVIDDGRGWLRAASIVAFISAAAATIVLMIGPTQEQSDLAGALAPADPVAALFMESK